MIDYRPDRRIWTPTRRRGSSWRAGTSRSSLRDTSSITRTTTSSPTTRRRTASPPEPPSRSSGSPPDAVTVTPWGSSSCSSAACGCAWRSIAARFPTRCQPTWSSLWTSASPRSALRGASRLGCSRPDGTVGPMPDTDDEPDIEEPSVDLDEFERTIGNLLGVEPDDDE